nr:ABC transporter ATP-binding protein [Limoniibacter endophyticus]
MIASPSLPTIRASAVKFRYGDATILDGIDFELMRGKTLSLLGPSGCGKTTLLRLIAGLLAPSEGSLSIGGEIVADAAQNKFLPPEKRNLGMVFQDYALWPHLSVAENVSFPLEMRGGIGKAERETRTLSALQRVGLEAMRDRRPSDLSGGQQQRVAIARALVAEPQIILFDEPLSNLDRELRESMVGELAHLIASLDLTAVYVTHDHSEAMTLADEIAVMRGGQIVQLASPDTLIERPATPEIAEFLRLGTIVDLEWRSSHWYLIGGEEALWPGGPRHSAKAKVLLPLRSVTLREISAGGLPAIVLRSHFRGDAHLVTVQPTNAQGIELQLLSPTRLKPGDMIGVSIDPQSVLWFDGGVPASRSSRTPALEPV